MITVLGATGYVGRKVVRALGDRGHEVRSVSRRICDYYSASDLRDVVAGSSFLINAAGYTGKPNVDACELDKAECLNGNAVLPGILRQVCELLRVPWIHISSGCIYTGSPTEKYSAGFSEADAPNFCFRTDNCSFYSGTKALGEEILLGAADCYVLRLRIPFNGEHNPRNYLWKIMNYDRLLDVTNSLSNLEEFVACCVHCVEQHPQPGIYNATSTGSVTTRDVVQLIRQTALGTKQFKFFDSEAHFMETAAQAPRSHCVLDNRKALAAGFPLSHVRDALAQSIQQLNSSATLARAA